MKCNHVARLATASLFFFDVSVFMPSLRETSLQSEGTANISASIAGSFSKNLNLLKVASALTIMPIGI